MHVAIGALVSLIDSTFPGLSIAGDSRPATSIFLSNSCSIVEAELQLNPDHETKDKDDEFKVVSSRCRRTRTQSLNSS